MMKKNHVRKYLAPSCSVVPLQVEYLLVEASGQHEGIGQGGSYNSAKTGLVLEDSTDKEFDTGRFQ